MFSQEVLKDFKTFVQLAAFFFAVPFDWIEEKRMLKLSRRPLRYFGWAFFALYELVYTLHVLSSLYDGICTEESKMDPARIAIDLDLFVGVGQSVVFNAALLKNMYQLPEFISQFMNFDMGKIGQKFERIRNESETNNFRLKLMIRHCILACTIFPCFVISLFLHNPKNQRYLLHHISGSFSWQQNTAAVIFFAILEFLMISQLAYANYTNFSVLVLWASSTNEILKQLVPDSNPRPQSQLQAPQAQSSASNSEEKVDIKPESSKKVPKAKAEISLAEKVKLFNQLRILSQMSNSCFSSFVWPLYTFILVFFSSFGLYGSVKLQGLLPLHIYLMFPVLFLSGIFVSGLLYPFVGKMFSLARNFIFYAEMKLNPNDKYGRRVVRSLRPFGCKIASIKIIKRTFLFIILWISNLTINAILLH